MAGVVGGERGRGVLARQGQGQGRAGAEEGVGATVGVGVGMGGCKKKKMRYWGPAEGGRNQLRERKKSPERTERTWLASGPLHPYPYQLCLSAFSTPLPHIQVGRRNPKYTLLGDTINVASRMESSSRPGRVQCTARTAALILVQVCKREDVVRHT